jgi:hypothetical protein
LHFRSLDWDQRLIALLVQHFRTKWERFMSANEFAFLVLAVGALTLLAGALGWASWMESREKGQRE